MRPIISDHRSVTSLLSTKLLPNLQKIEHSLSSTVTSSLQVAHIINQVNETISKRRIDCSQIYLATIDVDSLFTRIPQMKLLSIISQELDNQHILQDDEKEHFMKYLRVIINHNTFRVHDDFYLQTVGLPMGGGLSGTLANIYLGVLERVLIINSKILTFTRFMDDILMVSTFTEEEMDLFINNLELIYELPLTASFNRKSVTFLDMILSNLVFQSKIVISPYSRNDPIYPLPSRILHRGIHREIEIIKAQVLRAWRISTNDRNFSLSLVNYFQFLLTTSYEKLIRRALHKFLLPLRISTHVWHTHIPLCRGCRMTCANRCISVNKIMFVGSRYLSSREPINCLTPNVYVIKKELSLFIMELLPSLHLQETVELIFY